MVRRTVNPGAITIGVGLGVLIAVVSGVGFVQMLRLLSRFSTWKDGAKVVSWMGGLPAFWFGGTWLGGKTLSGVVWPAVLPWYVSSLSVCFIGLVSPVVIRYIARVSADIDTPRRQRKT